jgi:hypothetical protein
VTTIDVVALWATLRSTLRAALSATLRFAGQSARHGSIPDCAWDRGNLVSLRYIPEIGLAR